MSDNLVTPFSSSEVNTPQIVRELLSVLNDRLIYHCIALDEAYYEAVILAQTERSLTTLRRVRWLKAMKNYYDAIPVSLRQIPFSNHFDIMFKLLNGVDTKEYFGVRPPGPSDPRWSVDNGEDAWGSPLDTTEDVELRRAWVTAEAQRQLTISPNSETCKPLLCKPSKPLLRKPSKTIRKPSKLRKLRKTSPNPNI